MDRKDATDFQIALRDVLEVYDKGMPSNAVLRQWWKVLEAYPLDAVKVALDRHLARGKYAPRPADILALIEETDGRPGPEEAWTMALASYDEEDTVFMTDEIFLARNAALDQYDGGEVVGARMTFLEVYRRELDEARSNRKPVHWQLSLGTDPDRREHVVLKARRQGLIGEQQARQLLPNREEPKGDAAIIAGALTGKVVPFPNAEGSSARDKALREMKRKLFAKREAQAKENAEAEREARAVVAKEDEEKHSA